MYADVLRLDSNDSSILAEIHLHEDESQFVVFINKIDSSTQISPRPIRLTGLNSETHYKIELVNREELPGLSRGNPQIKHQEVIASGQYWMKSGVVVPWNFPNQCYVLKGIAVS